MQINPQVIRNVVRIIQNNPYRLKNRHGDPGGLLDLSTLKQDIIVIGDLHGSIENLKAIIHHKDNLQRLKNKEMIAVIIGDSIHNDQVGQMLEMESSLLVIEEVFRLIEELGDSLIYIRGNHDTFEPRLAKSAIKQGLEFQNYLLTHRSEEYAEMVSSFFEALPVYIMGDRYVITHAGPIRGGAVRDEIINIKDNPDYYHQLMWNRLHEFRGTPSMKEYGEEDIRKMNRKMGLPEMTPFIVGHNPMWNTGNRTGIWEHIIGIKNHYIIYSNIGTQGPYLLIRDGEIYSQFAVPTQKEPLYVR